MNKVFNIEKNSTATDIALLLTRVGLGVMMLVHGLPKMSMLFSGEPEQFPAMLGMSATLSLAMAVFAEVLCSILILTGFSTRLATIPLIITMAVAVFIVHAADPFSGKELAAHYLLGYVILLFAGAGRYSVDYLLHQKATRRVGAVKEQDAKFAL